MKRIGTLLVVLVLFFTLFPKSTNAQEHTKDQLLEAIEGIIEWKKYTTNGDTAPYLLTNEYLQYAGDTLADWYPIGLGRIGYADDFEAYLSVITDVVKKRYQTEDKLSELKSTEWHRISLAILASGGDPTNVNGINLIADGTYNRGFTTSIGAQGINGWIWGLITLDSMRYKIPAEAFYQREDMIKEILSLQVVDGGFSFYQDNADGDMTAMAIQSLAPYYNDLKKYTYIQKASKNEVTKSVKEVVDEALNVLSSLQMPDGDFKSWDEENVESTAQVVIALTALGINPLTDSRFIKNDQTLLDGILKYQMPDGGFVHAKKYNPDNPTSLPDQSNTMASEQVLIGLVSLYRYLEDYRTLYDFRPELSQLEKESMQNLKQKINSINDHSKKEWLEALYKEYLAIPAEERSYIFNFYKLADRLMKEGVTLEPFSSVQAFNVNSNGKGVITPIIHQEIEQERLITEAHLKEVEEIEQNLSTVQGVAVLKLIKLFEEAENREQYQEELPNLYALKGKIETLQKEIDALNEVILEELYPFDTLSLKDKETVSNIVSRFNQLPEQDQRKILSYEDVKKSEAQIDSLSRARLIKLAVAVATGLLVILFSWRITKRKKEKWITE